MRYYAKFSLDRQFAGFSPCRIPLSIRGSAGPAMIGAYPLLPAKPKGWRIIGRFPEKGLLVRTAQPRLVFCGGRDANWGFDGPPVCMHGEDLTEVVVLPRAGSSPGPFDQPITSITPQLVSLLAQHPKQLKLVTFPYDPCIRVSPGVRLTGSDWSHLGRHVFTTNSCAAFHDTAAIREHRGSFKVPGHCIDQVRVQWGVGVTKPQAYDGKHLYFTSLQVLDGAKLGRLFPDAARLEGRHLTTRSSHDTDDLHYSLSLCQALDAGIVPARGMLEVDSAFETIRLPRMSFSITQCKQPVTVQTGRWERSVILCPRHLVQNFLMSTQQAGRTFTVPDKLKRFKVVVESGVEPSDATMPGSYYLLTDLQNLPTRDLKREREERAARRKRIVDRYGSALPAHYEKFTDEQIASYFEIQDLAQQGEFIPVREHPLMPGYRYGGMIEWIQVEAPHLVRKCPLTGQEFLRRMESYEDLAEIPGFWAAIESTLGGEGWLRKLVTCPKVQAAALISAI
jgi:hypothetical protein